MNLEEALARISALEGAIVDLDKRFNDYEGVGPLWVYGPGPVGGLNSVHYRTLAGVLGEAVPADKIAG